MYVYVYMYIYVYTYIFNKIDSMLPLPSKCGKNKKVAHEAQPSVLLIFLAHFDLLCDLILNRRTATWNLFVLCNTRLKYGKNAFFFQISPL